MSPCPSSSQAVEKDETLFSINLHALEKVCLSEDVSCQAFAHNRLVSKTPTQYSIEGGNNIHFPHPLTLLMNFGNHRRSISDAGRIGVLHVKANQNLSSGDTFDLSTTMIGGLK